MCTYVHLSFWFAALLLSKVDAAGAPEDKQAHEESKYSASAAATEGRCASSVFSNDDGDKKDDIRTEPVSAGAQDPFSTEHACLLYLAPSTLPGAGLGLFAAQPIAKGSTIGGDASQSTPHRPDISQRQDPRNPFPFSDPIIEISDHRKTLPYRGQQRFASWLGYVWPRSTDAFYPTFYDEPFPELDPALYGVEEGLNGAQGGFFRVLEFYSSDCVEEDDDNSSVDDSGSCYAANTPHHGVTFQAIENISAGSELLMNYGGEVLPFFFPSVLFSFVYLCLGSTSTHILFLLLS